MKTQQHKNMKSLWRPWMFCKFFANVCDEFFAISQGEDSSADGASSLWAHGLARWRAATHSGHGIGHIAWDFTRFHSLFILQVKMAGPFQIRLFVWTEIAIMYFSLIYTQTLVILLQSTGHYIHSQLEDYSIFSHESSEVNWHFPPFLTLFDNSAKNILSHNQWWQTPNFRICYC